jgi:hypothetical protein
MVLRCIPAAAAAGLALFAGVCLAQPDAPAPAEAEALPEAATSPGFLGIAVGEAPAPEAAELDAPVLVVARVGEGSAAEAAGLRSGDTLLKFDDQRLLHPEQLRRLVAAYPAGYEATLTVIRDGQTREWSATLGERPPALADDAPPGPGGWPWRGGHADPLGNPFAQMLDRPGLDEQLRQMRQQMRDHDQLFEQMRRALEQQRGQLGDFPGLELDAPRGPGATRVQTIIDGEHRITVRKDADGRHLTVRDAEGVEIFAGPIDTPEQLEAVPADIRQKLPTPERNPFDRPLERAAEHAA